MGEQCTLQKGCFYLFTFYLFTFLNIIQLQYPLQVRFQSVSRRAIFFIDSFLVDIDTDVAEKAYICGII